LDSPTRPVITESPSTAIDPNDARYPRSQGFRVLRWILRLAWLAFLLYPANALFNVFSLVANGNSLTWESISHALLLDQLLQLLAGQPVAVFVGLLAAVAIILLGRMAHLDQQRERETLKLRGEHAHTQQVAQTIARAEAHAATESATATIIGHIDAHLAAHRAPVTLDDTPLGPPFDEALLPLPDHFVGRNADLNWLLERLRSRGATGITAVRGLGGIGKTSLAAVAVRQARSEELFPDGIAVVPCSGLSDASEVLKRILARFDAARRQPAANDWTGLAEAAHHLLDGKQVLIVLDNVEPSLTAGEVVAPLRATGAELLLTARQALPRSVVPADASRVLKLLEPDEALNVFCTALGRNGATQLSPSERTAAERIVTALDRHTLAIRLAGAYAADAHRDLGALARELEDPARAMALPEDETSHAVQQVFASSLDALPLETRRLFVTLAAFDTEEFGRRAVLAVGASLQLSQPEASLNLLVLRALLDASVDENMPERSDRERLRLHQLLRAYAATEFATWDVADRAAVFHAIAVYYAGYVGEMPDVALARDELNVVGALQWAHAEGQSALVVAICLGMQSFWHNSGHVAAIERYLPWGIAAAQDTARTSGRREDRLAVAQLDLTYAHVLYDTGKDEGLEERLLADLEVRRELSDHQGAGDVLTLLSDITFNRGEMEKCEEYSRQALEAFEAAQDRDGQGLMTKDLALLAYFRGEHDHAEEYCNRALELASGIDNLEKQHEIEMEVEQLQGQIERRRGQLADAERHALKAIALSRELGIRWREGSGFRLLGVIAATKGSWEDAGQYFEQSLKIAVEIQGLQEEGLALREMGDLARKRKDLVTAQGRLERSLSIAQETHFRTLEGRALFSLGLLARERGDLDVAEQLLSGSLTIARETQGGSDTAESCLALGRLLAEELGRYDEGVALLREALDRYTNMGMPEAQEARETLERLGTSG
jgi:tetratricopeptide (TPR) repeat protein